MPHLRRSVAFAGLLPLALFAARTPDPLAASFHRELEPLLAQYCYDCHGNGNDKGGVQFDTLADAQALHDPALWSRALRNVRTGLMPPASEGPLPPADADKIMLWIKRQAFGLDPAHPDPGRVTLRRLNRVEYRNTVRDLLGVEYDTLKEFPADDTGSGFDNLGAVLTISPMLLEKYLDAAQTVVAKAVPTQPRVVASAFVPGKKFVTVNADATRPAPKPAIEGEAADLSYYTPATIVAQHHVEHAGRYELGVDLRTFERYVDNVFDLNRCRLVIRADGEPLLDQEFVREGGKTFEFTFAREWAAGDHELSFEIQPVAPAQPQVRQLRLRLNGMTVRGPLEEKFWVTPANYAKFFPRAVPGGASARRRYARELLERFATRAFRRPIDSATLDRLGQLAEEIYSQPKNTFEGGVAQAMVAVLASPSFLFREENVEPLRRGQTNPFVDEYALASRLSYFFWSSMPDEELLRLAGARQLRAQLPAQLKRLLADPKANELVRNFTGQWLQARDIATVQVNPLEVALRDRPNPEFESARATVNKLQGKGYSRRTAAENAALGQARAVVAAFDRQPRAALTDPVRRAMQQETELTFARVLREDRSVVELIESDYTYLNEDLAKHYGIPGVTGAKMRLVALPPDSPRGGVLTQGTVLSVTSNPTRTSPVKRGVFILNSILGTPPAPPPPNIPALEDAASPAELKTLGLRETLALHAKDKSCAACHLRMDPIGLALEHFNAQGGWRDTEFDQPIQTAGKLITGEPFADVRELKHVLATARRRDFYYCLSEKLLTYALGRGLEYYDTDTVDQLVAQLEASGGKPSALLQGIVNSAPFQQRRRDGAALAAHPAP